MSMHPYIGARYVPRFLGTFDPTQDYEALDVVDNGSGTSYISKIPTPPGTPLTDTDHWALYGSASAAVASLTTRVDALENDKQDKISYDVHSFTGATIEDKLHAALDYAKANGYHMTILCNEEVDITTPYDLYDSTVSGDFGFATCTIIGAKFKLNGINLFTSSGSVIFSPCFVGCEFVSTTPVHIFDGAVDATIIMPTFNSCYFYHVGIVNNSAMSSNITIQSLHMMGCKVVWAEVVFCETQRFYDLRLINTQFETSHEKLIVCDNVMNSATIRDCVMETIKKNIITIEKDARDVDIINNYFESNAEHILDLGSTVVINGLRFCNNYIIARSDAAGKAIVQFNGPLGPSLYANLENNYISVESSDIYLANFEPMSSKRFGKGGNIRYVNGVLNMHIYSGRFVSSVINGYDSGISYWTYDSGANKYKATIEIYNDLANSAPFYLGTIKGLATTSDPNNYSLTAMFGVGIVKTNVGGTPTYDVLINPILSGSGSSSGTQSNVTISGTIVKDALDPNHHTLTLYASCTGGSYYGSQLSGRIIDIMAIPQFTYMNP